MLSFSPNTPDLTKSTAALKSINQWMLLAAPTDPRSTLQIISQLPSPTPDQNRGWTPNQSLLGPVG